MYSSYSVFYYTNGVMTGSSLHLSANAAYHTAVPGEALHAGEGSRWHLMMRGHALNEMTNLLSGESVRIAWQDHASGLDTEHILIVRDEHTIANMQSATHSSIYATHITNRNILPPVDNYYIPKGEKVEKHW
jgi:hypothetical protein